MQRRGGQHGAINAALAAAGLVAKKTRSSSLPGTYAVSAPLKVPENVPIMGASSSRCTLLAKGDINLFQLEAGGNEISNLFLRAETPQASGATFDFSHGFASYARLPELCQCAELWGWWVLRQRSNSQPPDRRDDAVEQIITRAMSRAVSNVSVPLYAGDALGAATAIQKPGAGPPAMCGLTRASPSNARVIRWTGAGSVEVRPFRRQARR